MNQITTRRKSIEHYFEGILRGDRIILSQAITLIESSLSADQHLATALVEKLLDRTGRSLRIGITGVPGVGKSTFIEAFGKYLTGLGKRIAVLTVDPSSQRTKGSILGDKTRMEELSKDPLAFIRPSASGTTLGGVAHKTRESMLLCEAAGFEIIIVETVGVGQSEVAVKNMVDFFLLLMLAGAGDELQGIKKGIIEMADAIVITKADGDNLQNTTKAKTALEHALHMLLPASPNGMPTVLTASSVTGAGIDKIWEAITIFNDKTLSSGYLAENRRMQNLAWLHECFSMLLNAELNQSKIIQSEKAVIEEKVATQKISTYTAAKNLLKLYIEHLTSGKE